MRRHAWFVAALLVAALAGADEARVIQLRHRPAADVIPVIKPLLGPDDAMTGMDYRLIIRTSDKTFRDIERLLAQIDTARRQLRISVKQTVARDAGSTDTGVSGHAGNGNTRIQIQRQPSPDKRGIAIGRQNGLQVETQQSKTTTRDDQTQFITALDGTRAFVRIGQSVPHITHILQLTGQQTILAQGVTYQDIVTGFDVLPQVQGQHILLQITPRLSHLRNPATGLADFQQYSTTVVVRPGEWFDIGGVTGNGEEVRRAILDSGTTQTGERRRVLLKVD